MRYVFDPRFTPVQLWWGPRGVVDRVCWGLGNHDGVRALELTGALDE